MVKKALIVLSITFLALMMSINDRIAHARFDHLAQQRNVSLLSGDWVFPDRVDLKSELLSAFKAYFNVETTEALYTLADFRDVLDAATTTDNPNLPNTAYQLADVFVEGVKFDVDGIYDRTERTSLGFLRPVDRTLDNGSPLYSLKGDTEPETEDDDPFTVYDVENTETGNTTSFRMDNAIELTSSDPIPFTSVSFYALMGLRESGEDLTPRELVFSVSDTKDGSYTVIASISVETLPENEQVFDGSPQSHAFPFYEIELDQSLIDAMPEDGYYLRIYYDGRAERGDRGAQPRSRVIIDNLTID